MASPSCDQPPGRRPRRIVVLGSPGSGKTTFCHRLAASTGLPLYHLDDFYWSPGWSRPTDEEWNHRVQTLCALPLWIADGNYASTAAPRVRAADLVVLFDRHPVLCATALTLRCLRLRREGREQDRQTSGGPWRRNPSGHHGEYVPRLLRDAGDPPVLSIRALLRKALLFRRRDMVAIQVALRHARTPVYRCRTRREAAALLRALAHPDHSLAAASAGLSSSSPVQPCTCTALTPPNPSGGPMPQADAPATGRTSPREQSSGLAEIADIVTPFAVRAAATLRLADHIAAGHTHLDTLAEAAGADPEALVRLLRFLICRDIFAEPEPGCFALTDLAEELLTAHPANLRQWLDADEVAGRLDSTFPHLVEAVRSGTSVYEKVHGAPFWGDLAASPERTASFDRLMAQVSQSTKGIGTAYDWSGVRHVLDVGGGTGTLLREILTAHPHLRGTVADQPASVVEADRQFAAHGLADRAEAKVCDMFQRLPTGADACLLSRVLADWDDESAIRILRTCASALPADGRVLVAERIFPHAAATSSEDLAETRRLTSHDLRMLVLLGGRKRSESDFADLAAQAELELVDTLRLPGGATVMNFRHMSERSQEEPNLRR